MAHLRLLFKKMGYQEENYIFWDFSTTIFDIKCRLNEISSCIGTPRGLVLVYVVLRPIICKTVSRISDRINRTNFTQLNLVKSYEVRLYTHNRALREIEISQEKSETRFWRSCCVD
jgi:hypothetical protein